MNEDASGSSKSQRARLTCTECHRRKIRCDKNVPCGTCLKRGIGHLCSREEASTERQTPARNTREESEAERDVVRVLLQRVADLEASLKPNESHQFPRISTLDPATPVNNESPSAVTAEGLPSADATGGDAATVLEFLAWGRNKDVDFANAPEHESGPKWPDFGRKDGTSVTDVLMESSKSVQLDILEALLPSRSHVVQLVEYHSESLLWYHGSYSAKIFFDHLTIFLTGFRGDIRHEQLNLQWLALLFSILSGSMTCASQATCHAWGFSASEQTVLSLQWYEATVTCLNMAKYTEVHTIYSVQAIATLTISAHILGKSSSQSVLLASAGRIAQSLGLHRLGPESTPTSPDQLRKREVGRRVFIQLSTQDWFQIPFSESYTLNPKFSHTIKPLNCNDDDMIVQPQAAPTQASYCNFRYDIAALMPQLLDAMADSNTLFTKYEQVLKYDAKMRELATASIPTFLSTNSPVADEWPRYISWARRSLTICAAHKIIMIHRKFVGLSFTNTAFSFTRRTCLAASKTILKEAFAVSEPEAPVLWIEQAFAVAAAIILSLDTFHRTKEEREFGENGKLIADTIVYLRKFKTSKIASRGVQLLSSLRKELDCSASVDSRKRAHSLGESGSTPPRKRTRALNVQALIREVSQNLGVTPPATASDAGTPSDGLDNTWDAFLEILPPHTGFDAQYLFDDFLPNYT
ncbi:hypothetical protein K458DRAFT_76464 [Lentithecium fluviatile CBS 122367]|uniref:Zn(2)-C6 fungal-type domain-containing protein n=1 Tax=Lentithecium fluviatile CBS 122367 TaxID=1168545 RepID=A0A6G1ITV7_9PLEO|nr:hypothetical protein K458DRAFT_76464 [Lentithecium fluviatile CBS 122367]